MNPTTEAIVRDIAPDNLVDHRLVSDEIESLMPKAEG